MEYFNLFDELQTESMDSLRIEDRVSYWRTRYKLDEKLGVSFFNIFYVFDCSVK